MGLFKRKESDIDASGTRVPHDVKIESAGPVMEPPAIQPMVGVQFVDELPETSHDRAFKSAQRFVEALRLNPGKWGRVPASLYVAHLRSLGASIEIVDNVTFARWPIPEGDDDV